MSDGIPAELLADSIAKFDDFLVGELDELSRTHADHLILNTKYENALCFHIFNINVLQTELLRLC